MKTYYIQFSTDFHLLAALASIEKLSESKVVLVGPKTNMAVLLAEKISAEFVVANPRSPRLEIPKIVAMMVRSSRRRDMAIVSPFVYPFYTFLHLLKEGYIAADIVRTDEGVGSYASIAHYYTSFKIEGPGRSKLRCAIRAFVKKTSVWGTKAFRICRENYLFKRDLSVNKVAVGRLKDSIKMLGCMGGLAGKTVFLSQPGVDASFESAAEYAHFIREVAVRIGVGDVVIKKHPSDRFDYPAHGLEIVEGFPLELYRLHGSAVVGFSSTALLTAKIISGCEKVYYLKKKGVGPSYNELSLMNKRLFDHYLQSMDYAD